ncbi:hypothetical protein [Rhodobacter capsulatus]|uniref:hypothetical protein n=1 Tax=Rhodobacter capsulatus TaxID=1061 RepID=UPI004029A59C
MSMRIVSIWVGGAALLAVSAATAALLLPSCEVALPFGSLWLGSCPGTILQDPLAEDRVASAALRAEIRSLEARLAGLDCPAPVAAPLPAPEPLPEPEPETDPPPVLDKDMIDKADLGDLQGCWALDSPYRTQNRATGEITEFSEWTVCFDAGGNGTETMRGSNGIRCEGPVSGSFVPGQALVIEEAANLPCSNDMEILQRRVTCRVDGAERASCSSFQPESGSSSEVIMRRTQEAP